MCGPYIALLVHASAHDRRTKHTVPISPPSWHQIVPHSPVLCFASNPNLKLTRDWPPLQVQGLQAGDWVVPLDPGQGTWRERAVLGIPGLHKISRDIPVSDAATMCIK